MKKEWVYALMIGPTMVACQGGGESNSDLDALISKRDSLKTVLAEVNAEIESMDTTKVVSTPLVTATTIRMEDFSHKVEVPGTVETDLNALINAEASGVITKIHVKEGQKVTKGQSLISIDAEILSSNIAELETSLELAEYMFEKQQRLMDQGVGIEIEYERAKNQKLSLEKKLKTLKSQRGKTVVKAPFTGVIDDIMVNVGEMAAPQFPLLRIVNNNSVTINASLSENLLSKVNEGTAVELVFPSMNDTTIVSTISNKGNYVDPTNRTFRVQIEIKDNKVLLPNQFVEVNVTDFTKKEAFVVDAKSILQDVNNRNYVYRLTTADEPGVFDVEKVYLEVLNKYQGIACIVGDIAEGDLIVVEGGKGITETDVVKIQERKL
ncbi:MAG: efflux RND transporter periplasmic adaptor subunit [Crocinitomicaceae bacterium]